MVQMSQNSYWPNKVQLFNRHKFTKKSENILFIWNIFFSFLTFDIRYSSSFDLSYGKLEKLNRESCVALSVLAKLLVPEGEVSYRSWRSCSFRF